VCGEGVRELREDDLGGVPTGVLEEEGVRRGLGSGKRSASSSSAASAQSVLRTIGGRHLGAFGCFLHLLASTSSTLTAVARKLDEVAVDGAFDSEARRRRSAPFE
jgi:hypothetical protein